MEINFPLSPMKATVPVLLLSVLGLLWAEDIVNPRSDAINVGSSPGAHFRIPSPADLTPERAEDIYQSIRDSMARHYGESSDPISYQYQQWERMNRFPYPSAVHGGMFVNNYTNSKAATLFARRDRATAYPAGSIIVKDGFIVTKEVDVLTGPLNIIEKVTTDNPTATAEDWRYIEIKPDGTVIGAGQQDQRTRFCASCHTERNGATAPFFFVPPDQNRR